MMKAWIAALLTVVVSLCPLPVGAQPAAAGKKLKIGIITNAVAPFWTPMTVGMEEAGKRLGVEVQWQGPSPSTVAKQKEIVETFRAQQVDAVAISPVESEPLTPVIDALMDAGILVVTIDSDAEASKRLAYIGTLNYAAGQAAGAQAVQLLPHGGKVVAFVGHRGAQNARDRIQGFVDATKDHGIELLDVKEDQVNPSRARQNVEDAIQSHPDADAFLGVWSYNAPAIAAAVAASGQRERIKIIGFDAEPQTLQHLEKGEIDVCIGQRPYLFGYLSVALLYNMLTLGQDEVGYLLPKDRLIDTGVDVITRGSLPAYREQLAKWGIKSS